MLSLEECQTYLEGEELSDEETIQLRNNLYVLINGIVDNHFDAKFGDITQFDI